MKQKAPENNSREHPTSRYSKWRAAVLASVYVLFALHFIHWKIAGRTLAPLEYNEVMYTFELGIITVGFLFMTATVASTLLFGRFFCSWGCHILALEDLCTWLLKKIRIEPRPVRSRFLAFVPLGVLLYMFVWSPLARFAELTRSGAVSSLSELPILNLRVLTDAEGWASFVTTDFWRNLPGPEIAILTFLVCGFIIVYLLGSRSFCHYICPYGAVFGMADRLAPGRIRLTGNCVQCATCTLGCKSNLPVHEEIARFGMVVSSSCFKDLDCIGTCPENAISFGYGRQSLFARSRQEGAKRRNDISYPEEVGLILIFAVSLTIFSGFPQSIAPWAGRLYGVMPLLLSVTLAVLSAFIFLYMGRCMYRRNLKFQGFQFKTGGRIQKQGFAFLTLASMWLLFVGHSGLVQYHMFRAGLDIERIEEIRQTALIQDERDAVTRGERHLQQVEALGLFSDSRINRQKSWFALVRVEQAELLLSNGSTLEATLELRRVLEGHPGNVRANALLGRTLLLASDLPREAIPHLERAVNQSEADPNVRADLAQAYLQAGEFEKAESQIRENMKNPDTKAGSLFMLGELYRARGMDELAIDFFRQAHDLNPGFPIPEL